MTTQQADLAVIGAGLTGQLAALTLATQFAGRLSVGLIGRTPSHTDSRSFFLSSSSVNLLEKFGLMEGLSHQSVTRMNIRDGTGSPAGRDGFPLIFDAADHTPEDGIAKPLGILVEATELSAKLTQALDAARITHIANNFTDLKIDNKALIELEGGTPFTARLTILADGRNSPGRKALGIDTTRLDYKQIGVVGILSHGQPHNGVAYQVFLPGGPLATLPLLDLEGVHRSALVWTLPEKAAKVALALKPGAFQAHLTQYIPAELGALIYATPPQGFPLILQLAKRYAVPHAVFIGDAAHVIHPLAGQGLNLGFRDIAALVDVIEDGLATGMELGGAPMISDYERWRRADGAQLAAATDALGRLYRTPGLGHIRRLGMGLMNRAGPLKSVFAREAAGTSGQIPSLLQG